LTVRVAHPNDGEGLIEHDFVATGDLGRVKSRMERHSHLSPRGKDIDGAVVIETGEGAIDRGRLGEFLHFITKSRYLVTRLLNGDRQFFVVRATLGQLTARLEELLFQYLNSTIRLVHVAEAVVVRVGRREEVIAVASRRIIKP
jgi:hypothetical protein